MQPQLGVRLYNKYVVIGLEVPDPAHPLVDSVGKQHTLLQPTEIMVRPRNKYQKPHIGKKQIAKELKRRKQPIASNKE
jgi:hypothetical protein